MLPCHHESFCVNCHTHWCYRCGATEMQNIDERGRGSRCKCPDLSWVNFCSSEDIRRYTKSTPYPHDPRTGSCVVCGGLVKPGPKTTTQRPWWRRPTTSSQVAAAFTRRRERWSRFWRNALEMERSSVTPTLDILTTIYDEPSGTNS